MNFFTFLVAMTLLLNSSLKGEQVASTYVDDSGVLRWSETEEEVCAFGTNYAPAFSYWKWRLPIVGDHKAAIDEDVYHFSRLGLDGYRLHIWESLLCDEEGNLLNNIHQDIFDYLVFRLKERDIKLFFTLMILGKEGGFLPKYGSKADVVSNKRAWPAQANYLKQFLSHVNPYTGIAYQDDPDIIALAIANEPQHYKKPELTAPYLNHMIDAIRSIGCQKPLVYNMTTSSAQIDEILASKIQGGTFQWYPTGLTSNFDLKGNFLPYVDRYVIPFDDKLQGKRPKLIYEFSPSDVGASSHLYPAMARSFREAGFQFAAHFSYDPLHAAYCNIEYRTHFMNLAYTPKKALGLMIAGEAFRAIPRGKSYGRYPDNNRFEAFRVSYQDDLAEMLTEEKFLYSNHTSSEPPAAEKLTQVAGYGNSSIVTYPGSGAYFLDKVQPGVWRLEVLPDAQWVADPFFAPHIGRETAVTHARRHRMTLKLPDLGEDFSLSGLNDGNDLHSKSSAGRFQIEPGTYLLVRSGLDPQIDPEMKIRNLGLKEFYEPKRKSKTVSLINESPKRLTEKSVGKISVRVVTPEPSPKVIFSLLKMGSTRDAEMTKVSPYLYEFELPSELLKEPGLLRYQVYVETNQQNHIFPGGEIGPPARVRRHYRGDRSFTRDQPFELLVLSQKTPISVFEASRDWESLFRMRRENKVRLAPSEENGTLNVQLKPFAKKSIDEVHAYRIPCREKIHSRLSPKSVFSEISIKARSLGKEACPVRVAFISETGACFSAEIKISTEADTYQIPLTSLKPDRMALIPRSYPKFQEFWSSYQTEDKFSLALVESCELSFDPEQEGIEVEFIRLK